MRIGELLVRTGVLTVDDVREVLRAQVAWGGRFGTNAVELGLVDLDTLARVVARQHALPAALLEHFVRADGDLQRMLSPELAARYACIPLRRVGSERVAIASIRPLDGAARALVADQLRISYKGLIPAIAPELRIHWQLEHVYGIPRDVRFLRSRKPSTVPRFDVAAVVVDDEPDLAPAPSIESHDVIDDAVPEHQLPELTPRTDVDEVHDGDRRHYIEMIDDAQPIARIDVKRTAHRSTEMPPLGKPVTTVADVARAIRRAPDRETIATLVIDAMARFVGAHAALLFVVRGEAATAWAGYRADGAPLAQIAVPSSLATDDAGGYGPLLLAALGARDARLVIAPIAVGEHVWSVLALAVERDLVEESLEAVTAAAAAAFARLLRYADR